ncbi:type 1 glutamine amidotransferase [Georgenia sunbinii]|uniref:type 1 glutamine amidotransferase n=1 Tax=Georgenia sunbinii TaxID=3117728 RepID=UPI002F26C4E1
MSLRPNVTVVQHSAVVPLGRFAGWLTDVDLRIVRGWEGEPVPAIADVGDALLVLGGEMNAYDDERAPWLPATRRLLADAVDAELPVLGICLGHQLLAAATGGQVAVAAPQGLEAGLVEVGWEPGAADDPLLAAVVADDAGAGSPGGRDAAVRSYQYAMHHDGVSQLPAGAVRLATSALYPVQAMRVGSALGVQFHPEASPERITRWAERHGATGPAVEAATSGRHDDEVARVAHRIARAFARQAAGDHRPWCGEGSSRRLEEHQRR